jgi:DMSO reductase anchor subunit
MANGEGGRSTGVTVAIILSIGLIILALLGFILGYSVLANRDQLEAFPILLTSVLGIIGPTVIALVALLNSKGTATYSQQLTAELAGKQRTEPHHGGQTL